jgi:hypothetical protein
MNDEVLEEVKLFDDNEKPAEQAVEPVIPPVEEPTFEIPTKFQGKSFEDVVEAYTNLEKENGRKANEVGELRKLTDEILKQQVSQQQQVVDTNINEEVGVDDFFDNPSEAVNKALANNPRLKQMEERLQRDTQRATHQELLQRHSDADAVVASPEFVNWVQSSPTRLEMFRQSHNNLDVDMADDLLNVYKTTKQASADEAKIERDAIAADSLKKASVERGSSNSEGKKPMYLRTELIRLKIEQPSRYAAMGEEIRQAYAEGRVK